MQEEIVMTKPKVSLVVIYHNAQVTIKDCINSILKQSFKDFELICVNNASEDSSENIVIELSKELENIKKISLPSEVSLEEAQNCALAITSGDFICFLDVDKNYDESFVSNLFAQAFSVKNNAPKVIIEKMYKREFLENIDIVDSIVENKIAEQSRQLKEIVLSCENFVKTELDKNSKTNIENVNNKVYDLVCRFNQLEKNMYDKAGYYETLLNDKANEIKTIQDDTIAQVYNDISKIYEFVGSEVNQKGCDINRVYEEITKNYDYTESLISQLKNELSGQFYNDTNWIKERLDNVEKDLVIRHVSMKRLFDIQLDEVDSRIKALGCKENNSDDVFSAIETSKIIDENVEKVYSHISKTNSLFYEELTKIYKDLNDKLIEKMKEQQYSFDKKIEDLRFEFNKKLEQN